MALCAEDENNTEDNIDERTTKAFENNEREDASNAQVTSIRHMTKLHKRKRNLDQWKIVMPVVDKTLFAFCLIILTVGFLALILVLQE